MFELVVSDLDGTLLNHQHQLSSRTIKVITQIRNQGIKFVIATGRHYQDVKSIASSLGGEMYLITSNGAQVHNKSNELLFHYTLDEALVSEILSLTRHLNIHRNIYQHDSWLVEQPNQRLLAMHQHSGFHYQLCDFDQLSPSGVTKFFFIAPVKQLTQLKTLLNERFGNQLSVSFSLDDCLEVMAKGVSKAQALSHILNIKSIEPSRVIGFGDGMNDHEMLKSVAHPVLMGNAHPSLRAQFSQPNVTLCCQQDGVADYLEKLIPGPELKLIAN